MLAALEIALEQALKSHALCASLRCVGTLPTVPDDKLAQRLAIDAPAIFVVPGAVIVRDELMLPEFTLACVVRNAAGYESARRGNGIDVGLDALLQIVLQVVHAQTIGGVGWRVERAEPIDDERLLGSGISVLGVRLSSPGLLLEEVLAPPTLADFSHAHLDIDVSPHAAGMAHQQWLQEPANHTTSVPDAQAEVSLR